MSCCCYGTCIYTQSHICTHTQEMKKRLPCHLASFTCAGKLFSKTYWLIIAVCELVNSFAIYYILLQLQHNKVYIFMHDSISLYLTWISVLSYCFVGLDFNQFLHAPRPLNMGLWEIILHLFWVCVLCGAFFEVSEVHFAISWLWLSYAKRKERKYFLEQQHQEL